MADDLWPAFRRTMRRRCLEKGLDMCTKARESSNWTRSRARFACLVTWFERIRSTFGRLATMHDKDIANKLALLASLHDSWCSKWAERTFESDVQEKKQKKKKLRRSRRLRRRVVRENARWNPMEKRQKLYVMLVKSLPLILAARIQSLTTDYDPNDWRIKFDLLDTPN